jgi:hypothetical protein
MGRTVFNPLCIQLSRSYGLGLTDFFRKDACARHFGNIRGGYNVAPSYCATNAWNPRHLADNLLYGL